MKNTIHITAILLLAASMTGCASTKGYFVDRARDTADIFTASVGMGAGARARVGPVHAGMLLNYGTMGLRGGQLTGTEEDQGDIEFLIFPVRAPGGQVFCHETFKPSELFSLSPAMPDHHRNKAFDAKSHIPFITTELHSGTAGSLTDFERQALRNFGMKPDASPPLYYLTQVEVQCGLLVVLRLGFNPGELLDFILGWTTIDIFNDDIELKKSNKPQERTSQ